MQDRTQGELARLLSEQEQLGATTSLSQEAT